MLRTGCPWEELLSAKPAAPHLWVKYYGSRTSKPLLDVLWSGVVSTALAACAALP